VTVPFAVPLPRCAVKSRSSTRLSHAREIAEASAICSGVGRTPV
jgi:hypothetical protein